MKIIVSCGDLNGIGMECFIKAIENADKSELFRSFEITLCTNTYSLSQYLETLAYSSYLSDGLLDIKGTRIEILECESRMDVDFGKVSKDAGALAAESIEKAVKLTIDGNFDAIVTLPIAKESVYLAGWQYPGHTEMLADRCGRSGELMILVTDKVRVTLATVHTPLSKVPSSISIEKLILVADEFNESLKNDFGISKPAIALLGLNPHAGENGNIGREEIDIIEPALSKIKSLRINARGPFPADGFFAHGEYLKYDGIIAMYHDQGLVPLKLLGSGGGINFTAGLPIVRTSPDHGTAFDIAGKGIANERSTIDSLNSAVQIAKNRANLIGKDKK